MSKILRDRIHNSIGKRCLIFTSNGFRYEGKITNSDDIYIEILDKKLGAHKIIELKMISDLNILKGGERANERKDTKEGL